MKKIFLLLPTLLLCAGSIGAQSPANRTATTVIADVLAQVPAQDKALYAQQQKDLLSTGENGIVQLVKMLEISDERKAKVELAVSGLTHFVSAQEQRNSRLTVANAYLNAIDQLRDKEAKAFVIRQLEIAGGDESVGKLSSFLSDEYLSSPAAVALAAIHSPAAGQALVDALNRALSSKQKENVVRAIGYMQAAGGEKILKEQSGSADPQLQGAVWYALGRVGSAASLPDLAAAAKKAGYAAEATGAVAAYLTLTKRLLAQGA
ncbi:MAG: HEAT repeat domain-containing protein, partial [Prevotellaceae bacterium]|nr:HEAT repeat domain-containing protein [Prevotellaceae bacterium]